LLIGTAVFAVVWPLFAQSLNFGGFGNIFGGATRPPVTTAPIVITVPAPMVGVVGANELVFAGLAAFAVLAAIIVGSVVAVGLIITLLMRLGGKFTTQVAESEAYQTHVSALEQKETEKLKAKRERQPATPESENYVYGLDPISYSLLILFFVAVAASLMYELVFTSGEITLFGQTFYSGLPLLLVSFIITIPLLAWRVRRQRLEAVAEKDNGPIPWDFIAILVLGLLVVGVGMGLMLYYSVPA